MRLKTNLVVGLVFIGLLGYVYVFEVKKREQEREAAEKSSLLLDVEEDDVAKLTIDKGDTVIVLESRLDGWWLTQPVADLADDAAVGRLIRNLRESERERVIADSSAIASTPDKAAQYQLDPPRLRLTVEAKGSAPEGTATATIRYGADNPTDTYVYVQREGSNPEVFTVRAWRYDNVDKSVFDLRDRRVIDIDEKDVRDIELDYGDRRIALTRAEGDEWRLIHPVEAAADDGAVGDLLRQLGQAKIARFADDAADAAFAQHGLEQPMVTVSMTVGEDRAEKRLTVSGDADLADGGRLAVDASRTPVFEIDSLLVRQLQLTAFDVRDKKPIVFDKESVTRIEFTGTDGHFVAEKDTAAIWSILEPEAAGAKTWVVNGFLSDLKLLEVVRFAGADVSDARMKEFGLDDPRILVDLYAGDESVLGLRVGGEQNEQIYVTLVGERSVFAMDGEKIRGVDLKLEDISKKPAKGEVDSDGASADGSATSSVAN